jgi:MHS family proline/betaine transporter-like MFS transporter
MLLKNKVFSSLGSSLEWFDFALYGFLGPIISQIFFAQNQNSKWSNLIITYAIFAVGYLARPMGALIFGYLGDRYGRLFSLRLTPIFITLTTIIISALPTYHQIGTSAIYLLLLTRIAQGIFLGGEFAGNIVYLCESSNKWTYFWGSIGSCTGSLGIMMASALASLFYSLFSKSFMLIYGWRLAFLLSIPFGVICLVIRLKMHENPIYSPKKNGKNPILIVIKQHKKLMALCLGLIYLHAASYYFVFMFLPITLTHVKHIAENASLINNTIFLLIHLVSIPIFGLLVNYIGGVKSLIFIACVFMLTIIPSFYLINYGDHSISYLSILFLSLATAFNAAVIPGLLSKLIPIQVRYTILAIAFNAGFGLFGGTMPVLGMLLINKTNDIISPAFYIAFAALVTLISAYLVVKNKENYAVR